MLQIRFAIVMILVFALTACGVDSTTPPVPSSTLTSTLGYWFAPQYMDIAACSPEAQVIIRKYGLDQVVVRCESKTFKVDGKDIHLVLLVFGPGSDCPEGCIFNDYCAVVEDGVDYPYTFRLDTNLGSLNGDWRGIEPSTLAGRSHRVASLPEFQALVNNEDAWKACSGMSIMEMQQATVEAKLALEVTPENIPVFIRILQYDQDWENRSYAVVALGMIGSGDEQAITALIQALDDEHYQVRLSVISALGEIGPQVKGVVPALAQALEDKDPSVRVASIRALVAMGSRAVEAVPALVSVLEDEDEDIDIRAEAIWALHQIGPGAAEAVPALIQVLEDENWKVRGLAVATLKRMGCEAIEAIPALVQVLEQDENATIRADAAWAIREINPGAVEAIPALIQAVEVDYWQLQREAIQTLRRMGPDAKRAVPVLIRALEDDDWQVREAAAGALRDITDRDFGADPSVWKEWWEEEN